jgi:hypothetical protein
MVNARDVSVSVSVSVSEHRPTFTFRISVMPEYPNKTIKCC